MYFNIRKIDLSTKTPVYSVQFLYETENTISLSLTKSRNCKAKLPLLVQEKQIPFFRTLSQISRLRLLTGKLETPDLGKKENAGSLAKFSTFYPYEGIGAGKARGVYHFYGNWLFSLPFFGKTAKRFALSLGRKYSILFREVFIYRGSMPCMTNVRRKSLWHLLRSPKRTTSRLSP